MASGYLHAAGLLLLLMLPLLHAVPTQMLEMENSGEGASDERRASDQADSWDAGRQSPAEKDDGSAEPEVQVEATKRRWIEELTANAESTEESADLIEEIRTRASGDGLRHLKAACRALCARCVCGVILMPSLPTGQAGKSGSKLPIKLNIPPAKSSAKPAAKKHENPTTPQVKPTKSPTKTEAKPVTTLLPVVIKKETVRKAKKWLLNTENQESQLPEFLLDEDISSSVYKKEVDDHDPLSASGDAQSQLGID